MSASLDLILEGHLLRKSFKVETVTYYPEQMDRILEFAERLDDEKKEWFAGLEIPVMNSIANLWDWVPPLTRLEKRAVRVAEKKAKKGKGKEDGIQVLGGQLSERKGEEKCDPEIASDNSPGSSSGESTSGD